MKKLAITAKELRGIGFPESPVIPIAMQTATKHLAYETKEIALQQLENILQQPQLYLNDSIWGKVAERLLPKQIKLVEETISLNHQGVPFSIFGQNGIEQGALHQMYHAAKLPIAVAGALMPDAHQGYGLPIGGVLATNNAVIPYGVGVDIGCRMCLSVFDLPVKDLQAKKQFFVNALQELTLFGSGAQFDIGINHEVMENSLFNTLPLLKKLHTRAWKQLGTSGSGNHFVEFGKIEILEDDVISGMLAGEYIGFLSHSGSRGLGANIANYYTNIAISKRRLPQEAKQLAWLNLHEAEGDEYWQAMNLAGEYASACHHIIHTKVSKYLGAKPIKIVENHHNFAWKEIWEGTEVIVHRKGATPAALNQLGIIPGSMTANGYIVKGLGNSASVNSASHGAGRLMSRSKAIQSFTQQQLQKVLQQHGVTLIGGGLDEAPFAYKNIDDVMQAQQHLISIVGKFVPKIVKMDGATHNYGKKPKIFENDTVVNGE